MGWLLAVIEIMFAPVMNVTLLNRSKTTCTTVPLALGNFLVSFLNASAGMTAKVVSTVARAIVPLKAIDPALPCLGFLGIDRDEGRADGGGMPGRIVDAE